MSIALTALLVLIIPFALREIAKKFNVHYMQVLAKLLFGIYIVGVFYVTLGIRTYEEEAKINLHLFKSYEMMFRVPVMEMRKSGILQGLHAMKWIGYLSWSSVILNILLFVPLGYLLPTIEGEKRMIDTYYGIAIVGLFVSSFIEVVQLLTHRGWFDVDDLFHNTMGTAIGLFLYRKVLVSYI